MLPRHPDCQVKFKMAIWRRRPVLYPRTVVWDSIVLKKVKAFLDSEPLLKAGERSAF